MKTISWDTATISYDRILCAEIIGDDVWVTIERSGVEHRYIVKDGDSTSEFILKGLRDMICEERICEAKTA